MPRESASKPSLPSSLATGVAAVLLSLGSVGAASAQVLDLLTSADEPIYLTHAGDDRLFVVEREGELRIWDGGAFLAAPFLDLSNRIDTTQEGGFLSAAFHPDYASNGRFFVSYTTDDPQTGFTSIVSRFEVSSDPNVADPAETVLLRLPQPFFNHNGGQLQFGPDGMLYVGFGDGGQGDDPGCRAQDPQTWHGKLLRIDVDNGSDAPPYYSIPPDNPYSASADGALDEIWAWGLRNPWRFSFDRERGDLWIGDVGQSDVEEVDREAPNSVGGRNYGWKVMEGSNCRNPQAEMCGAEVPGCNDPAYQVPHYEYDHGDGRSITGGYVYRGSRAPGYVGAYVFADFGFGRVWTLHHTGGGNWTRTAIPGANGSENSWSSFGEGADGELYLLDTFGRSIHHLDLAALPPLSPAPVPLPADPPSRPPYPPPGPTGECGNGEVEPGEQCDDGNQVSGDGCTEFCQIEEPPAVCGDGVLGGDEECDDGNTVPGDGCDAECLHEACGDGIVGPLEECDDGNTIPDDECDEHCRVNVSPLTGDVRTVKIGVRFDKSGKDKLSVKISDWELPDGLVPTSVRVDVGGSGFEGPLDAKGRYRSPDKRDRVALKRSRKTGLWKLTVRRKKGTFSASLVDDGVVDEDVPKPGVRVTVPVTIELAGVPFGDEVDLVYRAKRGKSGTAK